MSGDLTKKYYKIGDVAEITGVPLSTLRYWESCFADLKPRRNAKGTRYYTPEDIDTVNLIKFLLHDRGLKIEAAQEQMRANRESLDRTSQAVARLRDIRSRLQELLDGLSVR